MKEVDREGTRLLQKAEKELKFSPEEKDSICDYYKAMFAFVTNFINNPENQDKELKFEDVKAFADERFPEGWPLVEKLSKKMTELEKTVHS